MCYLGQQKVFYQRLCLCGLSSTCQGLPTHLNPPPLLLLPEFISVIFHVSVHPVLDSLFPLFDHLLAYTDRHFLSSLCFILICLLLLTICHMSFAMSKHPSLNMLSFKFIYRNSSSRECHWLFSLKTLRYLLSCGL